MNLTVGPLPPAVYWRRRAIVIGVLLLVVILFASTCSGSGGSGSGRNASHGTPTGSSPSSQPSILTPVVGGDGGGGDGGDAPTTTSAAPTSPDAVAPAGGGQPSAQGPCRDGDLSLTAMATPLAQGFYLSMKVKNISSIACSRDLGGGPEALQVFNGAATMVWTSDWCNPAGRSPAPDMRTFGPGIETVLPPRAFYWDGTLGKCSGGTARPAGIYRLVARLDTKASQPLTLTGK